MFTRYPARATGILRSVSTVEGTEHIRGAFAPLRVFALALLVAAALLTAGCGGGQRQDANAPSGDFKATVLEWHFPKDQPLGTPQNFTIKVRNDDSKTIPHLIITISGLRRVVYQQGAASDVRPNWLPKDVQYATVTPYNSALDLSYDLGALDPGAVRTYTINLTPLRRGVHQVGYRLAPALFGDNKVVNAADGSEAAATREVTINPTPVFDENTFKD